MHQTKTGILLANLGTPDAPTPDAVKRYLRQFLSDKRVVDTPRLLWWPLLRGIILPIRAPRVAKLYQSVWMAEGSPLMVYSRQQQQALAARLPDVPVALGMSYGSPSLASAVDELLAQDVDHIVVLPLYPQYSCSTVAAVWDELARILAKKRAIPGISFIRDYADDADYIHALAASVRASFAVHGEPDVLLLSYHGIPQRYAHEGDDYPQRCRVTTRELVSVLGLLAGAGDDDLPVALWSRTLVDAIYRRNAKNAWREGHDSTYRLSVRASPPTVWKRWKKSRCRTGRFSLRPAVSNMSIFRRLMPIAAHIEMMVNLTAPYR